MLAKITVGIAIVVGLSLGATDLRAAEGDRSVEALAERLVTQLAEPGPQAAAELRERLEAGVPPGALVVWLDAYRATPRFDLVDVVSTLASYRRVEVRGRALAALAANGGNHSVDAIERAAADGDATVRRLALALAERHPSASADEIVRRLLARDPELAASVGVDEVPEAPAVEAAPEAPPAPGLPAQPSEDVVVVEDEP